MSNKARATEVQDEAPLEFRPVMLEPETFNRIVSAAKSQNMDFKSLLSRSILVACEKPELIKVLSELIDMNQPFKLNVEECDHG